LSAGTSEVSSLILQPQKDFGLFVHSVTKETRHLVTSDRIVMTVAGVAPEPDIPYLQLVLAFSIIVYILHLYLDVRQVSQAVITLTALPQFMIIIHTTIRRQELNPWRASVEGYPVAVPTIAAEGLVFPGRIREDAGLPSGQMVSTSR
jgi:hypothetical protein